MQSENIENKLENLLTGIKNFSENLKKEDNFLLISHIDADGIASCAIIVDLLKFLNKKFLFRNIKQLYGETLKEIFPLIEKSSAIIFTDMGSGQIDIINEEIVKKFPDKKIFIIDHHPPKKEHLLEKIKNTIYQVNPFIYQIDGSFEISAAGMCYLVAKLLNRKEMVDIAIVGAVGDMQDSSGKLMGVNRKILEDGVELKVIEFKKDIRLFGRESRPLIYMLAYASDPFIPELSGNINACKEFLHSIGIKNWTNSNFNEGNSYGGKWISYVDLCLEDKKKLLSALYVKILNYDEKSAHYLVGEVYTLLKEKKKTVLRDAKEFATLLNACGRLKESETGVYVCIRDIENRDENIRKANNILERYRDSLKNGIEYLKTNGVKEMKNFYYFDAGNLIDDSIVGVVAGMIYNSGITNRDKAIIGMADDSENENLKKISGRANMELVRKGLHLGNLLRECCAIIGGEGGGHSIAAGARIPKDKVEEFLKILDEKM